MIQITEKLVKERIKIIIKAFQTANDIYTFCPMTFGYGESGHPDRIVVANGRFLGVEVKKDDKNSHCRPDRKPTKNEAAQRIQAERIKRAGGEWMCIHSGNLKEFVDWLARACDVSIFELAEEQQEKARKACEF